jgi:tellurium resistance protein TerD
MAVSLEKGQRVNLVKKDQGLGNLVVGLGWDPVKPKRGFFKKLTGTTAQYDLDASVLMLHEGDKFEETKDLIYYGNLQSKCNSVIHKGDNLTGSGVGDDEQIFITLDKVPNRFSKLLFVVNIYQAKIRKQHFGMIKNCFIRVFEEKNGNELVHYKIGEAHTDKTAIIVASVERDGNGGWSFSAIGEGTNDSSLDDIMKCYR